MKRIFIFLITLLLVLVQAEAWTITYAAANIPVACTVNQYSVDRITGKDQFTKLGCFNETQFQQAYDFMLSEAAKAPNVVIRHEESYSPMNIVAADRAMAYSQNHTYLYSDTINVWRDKAQTVPYTYISQANPLYYYNTQIKSKSSSEVIKPSDLVAEIEVNGARGFIQVNGIDIIPLIYVENRANNWYISFTTRKSLDNTYTGHIIRPNITQYKVADVTSTTKTGNVTIRQISVQVDTALYVNTYSYGVAPDWLANGTYYSPNGIVFYTDMDLKNPVTVNGVPGRYFNYYDFLNLRTVTQYSAQELDEYFNYYFAVNKLDPNSSVMKDKGSAFVNAQNTYGMNALMIYSMAIHESAYGTSGYAVNRFNLFGYGAYDSNPDSAYTFDNVEQSVEEHMGINLRHYLDYSNYNATANSSLFYASNIGTKGAGINTRYASDPWWSIKIAGYAFRIDRYLGLKDLNKYQIAILNSDASRVVYSKTDLTTPLYTIDTRATNYPFTIKATSGDVYYVQSTNPLVNGVAITGSTAGLVPYNITGSTAYINKAQVTFVNTASEKPYVVNSEDTLLTYVTNWDWQENNLYIKGWAALKNTNMAMGEVTHQLNAVNMLEETQKYTFDLNIATENYPLNLGNGYNYTTAWFDGVIDVGTLPEGNYHFEIITKSGDTSGKASLANSTVNAPRSQIVDRDGYAFRFSFNNTRGMRYELSKEIGLSITGVTPLLPTRFNSTAYMTTISIEEDTAGLDLINITGISYMQNINMTEADEPKHELLFVDSTGKQHIYPLRTSTGVYDISNGGYNYSRAWYYAEKINIDGLADGDYRVLIITSNKQYKDVVEVRDILIKNTQSFTSTNKTYTFEPSLNIRRRYVLNIKTNNVEEVVTPPEDTQTTTP